MAKERLSVKDLLKRGLLDMLVRKPYMNITVTDIVEAAGVARVSFYRNYSSVSDVVDDLSNDLSAQFVHRIYPVINSRDPELWRNFLFELFHRLPPEITKIYAVSYQNAGLLLSRINAKVQLLESRGSGETVTEKYTAFGKMGLLSNIVKRWIDEGMRESPEEMVDYIMSFILLF